MRVLDVIILGATQGITEFLPISSSGHLILVRRLFGISDVSGTVVDAFLHLGTLLAVLWYYRRVWWRLGVGVFSSDAVVAAAQRQLAVNLVRATVPAVAVGLVAERFLAADWRSLGVLRVGFLLTAAVLFLDNVWPVSKLSRPVSRRDAWVIGLAQVIALVPAISRSGVTIIAGRARGLSRSEAVTFSFLISAPVIAGAGLLGLFSLVNGHVLPWWQLAVGLGVSFVSGVVAISVVMRVVERMSLAVFGVYLVFLAASIGWHVF